MAVNETGSFANMRNRAAFLTARRLLEKRCPFVMLAHLLSVFCILEKYALLSLKVSSVLLTADQEHFPSLFVDGVFTPPSPQKWFN